MEREPAEEGKEGADQRLGTGGQQRRWGQDDEPLLDLQRGGFQMLERELGSITPPPHNGKPVPSIEETG